MRLLQLSSSNPKFKTLNFSKGLNIVAGLQLTDEDKKSINGIGKSFPLKLIHYLLGASFDPRKTEDEKLKDYLSNYGIFKLNFIHKKKEYSIKKNFKETCFYINDEEISQTSYPEKLKKIFLGTESPISFRQLFNCFARRFGGIYYTDILTQQGLSRNDYYQRFVNLYLLGIDIKLVKERFDINEKLAMLDKASSVIKKYEEELDKTNLKDLKDEIVSLNQAKNNFMIAENYDQLKKEGDKLTTQMNALRNEIFFTEKRLEKKKDNLKSAENIDIDINQIKEIYSEAKFFFDQKITKRLSDVQDFHNSLVANRKTRLSSEIKELEIKVSELSLELERISKQRDDILKDLDNKGALEEYNSIMERIKSKESERDNLEKYEKVLSDFKKDKSRLNVENALVREKSILFIEEEHEFLESIESKFRKLVKRFYDNHGGSFKIEETEDAKYLFNINVHIPREGSQGVGEVKIFCYDILLYQLNKHLLEFMAHDSCIFSEMDPRQKSTIFKIILELIKEGNFQYFLNIGQNTLHEVLDGKKRMHILTDDEKQIIKDSIILELYDKNPKSWLFGEAFG